MFSIGQIVLYGSSGVCKIDGITVKNIGKQSVEYYVLKPVYSQTSTFFVPTGNISLVSKMRPVATPDEINEIICNIPLKNEWIDNKQERCERFRTTIADGKLSELINVIRQIHFHAREVTQKGKRIHVSDERFLKEAESMVCDEISLVMNIDRGEVLKLILEPVSRFYPSVDSTV